MYTIKFYLLLLSIITLHAGDTPFTVTNQCPFTIWVGITCERSASNPSFKLPYNGGWALPSGQTTNINIPFDLTSGRIWGRTGCTSQGTNCATGDCGALQCAGKGGAAPVTLAEFALCGWECLDFYDISLVDGFNLPMIFKPKSVYPGIQCPTIKCITDVNARCPNDLKVWKDGKVLGCQADCIKYNRDKDCCRGAYDNRNCPMSPSATIFHNACPDAYSYAKDDVNTKPCKKTGYDVIFCGEGSGGNDNTPTPTPTPTPSSNGFVFRDSDISGGDIGSTQRAVWSDCYDACYATTNCKSFTWSNYNGGTCWLKSVSDRGKVTTKSGNFSGFLCDVKYGNDVGGNDVGNERKSNSKSCCGACAKNSNCKAFSWNSYNGGTCWLKSGGTLTVKSGVEAFTSV